MAEAEQMEEKEMTILSLASSRGILFAAGECSGWSQGDAPTFLPIEQIVRKRHFAQPSIPRGLQAVLSMRTV